MKSRLALSTAAGIAALSAAFAVVSMSWKVPVAVAQAVPTSSGSAGPAATGQPPHVWPTEASAEPAEDEWAGAKELPLSPPRSPGWSRPSADPGKCAQNVIREWVRITCPSPVKGTESDARFGVIWGLAGDVSAVKGKMLLAGQTERYKAPPVERPDRIVRQTGASATVTFQLKPGSAFLLAFDTISWAWEYDGGFSVSSSPGFVVDVSWAAGEASPTILYR